MEKEWVEKAIAELKAALPPERIAFLESLNKREARDKENEKIQLTKDAKDRLKIELGEIYERIITVLREYCDLREEYYTVAALWIIGTYLHKSFNTFPYLFLNAMRGSGKTRMLKLISSLAHHGEMIGSPTEAVLFRIPPETTLCIDEFEGVMRKGNEGLRELLNACYKKGMKIRRMKKKSTPEGSEMVVEEFEPYKPICLANIWGMEEVLGDRCITLILEKSTRKDIMRLVEDFDENIAIKLIKSHTSIILTKLNDYFNKENYIKWWNLYVKEKYSVVGEDLSVVSEKKLHHSLSPEECKFEPFSDLVYRCSYFSKNTYREDKNITTPYTLTTLTTQNTLTTPTDYLTLFNKIDETGINGRNLELFFPLLMIGHFIGSEVFKTTLKVASSLNKEKREEEMTESRDVGLIDWISKQDMSRDFMTIKKITNYYREYLGDDQQDEAWINTKWVGRALRRLNMILDKRRMRDGVEVRLNVDKAKSQMESFLTHKK